MLGGDRHGPAWKVAGVRSIRLLRARMCRTDIGSLQSLEYGLYRYRFAPESRVWIVPISVRYHSKNSQLSCVAKARLKLTSRECRSRQLGSYRYRFTPLE
jgi:hypothetical protein